MGVVLKLARTSASPSAVHTSPGNEFGFEHLAYFYADDDEFLSGTVAFIREGIEQGEAQLVAVSDEKIARLRRALGKRAAARVQFVDMVRLGRNPSAIIPAWYRFAEQQQRAGTGFRGIGEPIWAARTPDELVECERHEALLNLAFWDGPSWKLLCPYDTRSLPSAVLDEARKNHPVVASPELAQPSHLFPGPHAIPVVFDAPLEPIPAFAARMSFTVAGLGRVRAFVRDYAHALGMTVNKIEDLVLAASEIAANAIVHGAGTGDVALWRAGNSIVCEVRDSGIIHDPLAGRRPPGDDDTGGRGLWMANQLCDLVQLRNLTTGSVVRLHLGWV